MQGASSRAQQTWLQLQRVKRLISCTPRTITLSRQLHLHGFQCTSIVLPAMLVTSRFARRCRFLVKCDTENSGECDLPAECPSTSSKPCTGSKFRQVEDSHMYTNHQEIKIQEKMQCLEVGSVPSSVTVVLQDELADTCQPGGMAANSIVHVV